MIGISGQSPPGPVRRGWPAPGRPSIAEGATIFRAGASVRDCRLSQQFQRRIIIYMNVVPAVSPLPAALCPCPWPIRRNGRVLVYSAQANVGDDEHLRQVMFYFSPAVAGAGRIRRMRQNLVHPSYLAGHKSRTDFMPMSDHRLIVVMA